MDDLNIMGQFLKLLTCITHDTSILYRVEFRGESNQAYIGMLLHHNQYTNPASADSELGGSIQLLLLQHHGEKRSGWNPTKLCTNVEERNQLQTIRHSA